MRLPHLFAAALVLCAATARGDEASPPSVPPAPVTPVSVGELARLLRSTVAAERERGEALLVRALRDAPDRADFLERLARALREDTTTTVVPAAPTPAPVPLPGAPVPNGAQGRAEPQTEAVPQQAGEDQAKADPVAKPAKVPTWTLHAWGVSVPAKEAAALRPQGAVQVENENGGQAEASGPTENARAWAEAAQRAADAQPLGDADLALPDDDVQYVHLGPDLTYRCCVVPSKGGAWAVETRTIENGLALRATKTKAGLVVEPVWVTVAHPIATEATRPAPDVNLELDRPDWSAARTRHVLPLTKERGAGFLVIPGILPDENRHLVIVLELRPKP